MAAITAIFEKGMFRPTRPVALAEGSIVSFELAEGTEAHPTDIATPSTPEGVTKRPPMFGSAKGVYILSPDFDEPLPDFEEYT